MSDHLQPLNMYFPFLLWTTVRSGLQLHICLHADPHAESCREKSLSRRAGTAVETRMGPSIQCVRRQAIWMARERASSYNSTTRSCTRAFGKPAHLKEEFSLSFVIHSLPALACSCCCCCSYSCCSLIVAAIITTAGCMLLLHPAVAVDVLDLQSAAASYCCF